MSSSVGPYIFPDTFKLLTANYTAEGEKFLLCDPTSGSFTVTMPAMSTALTRPYFIKRTDASANTVTIALTDGTIDGSANYVMTAKNSAVVLYTDGVGWFVF